MSSAICFNKDKSKILSSGNGLMLNSLPNNSFYVQTWGRIHLKIFLEGGEKAGSSPLITLYYTITTFHYPENECF